MEDTTFSYNVYHIAYAMWSSQYPEKCSTGM